MNNQQADSNRFLSKRILLISGVIVLLVVGFSLFIFKNQERDILLKEEAKIESALSLVEQFVADEVNLVAQDLEFFRRNPAYADYLDVGKLNNERAIVATLEAYLEIRQIYQAVTLVDLNGAEQLKIVCEKGNSETSNQLGKINTTWLKTLYKLKIGDIAINNIELYSVNGSLTFPPETVIQFASPIYRDGIKRGYVIAYYKADRLLNKMRYLEEDNDLDICMATEDGFWIKGFKPEDGFSHVLTPENTVTAKAQFPLIWDSIIEKPEQMLNLRYGLLGYRSISLKHFILNKTNRKLLDNNNYFISVLVPRRILAARLSELKFSLFAYAVLILLLVLPVIYLLSRQIRKAQSEILDKNTTLDKKNKELQFKTKELEDSLLAQQVIYKERVKYLTKLESKDADLKVAQEIAQLAYYHRNVLTNTAEWSENLPSIFGVSQDYDFSCWKNLRDIIHPDDFDAREILWAEALREGKDFKYVYRIKNKNSTYDFIQDIAKPMYEGKLLKYMHGTVQNITERVKVEEELRLAKNKAEQATKAKSNFLATMSHEIRTPLNAVLGMANLLKITELTDKQKDFVRTIESSGDALLSVINDVLDFSRIESGRMSFEQKWFDVNKLLEDALQVVAINADRKNLRLFYSLGEEVPNQICGDENRIKQALINFLNNAVKFSEKGHVSINVGAVGNKEDKIVLRFSVSDTGIGISEENRKLVFQAFQQADSSVARLYGGSGLGLAITKKLVEAMQGSIGLTSTLGKGSTFYFELPFEFKMNPHEIAYKPLTLVAKKGQELTAIGGLLKYRKIPFEVIDYTEQTKLDPLPENTIVLLIGQPVHRLQMLSLAANLIEKGKTVHFLSSIKRKSEQLQKLNVINRPLRLSWLTSIASNQQAEIQKIEITTKANKHLNILVAEDNPVNEKLIKLIFTQMGYEISIAHNGVEAVEMCEKIHYDIVFMDVQMPVLDGIEATKKIRESQKIKSQPIIIALTANAMQGQKETYLEAGMDDYLSKPIDFKLLTNLLDTYGQKD